jgi:hypothetical protein
MGGAISGHDENPNLFLCIDTCCTEENLDRRSISGVMKTPRNDMRRPNLVPNDDDPQFHPDASSWVGPHLEVHDGVVQLEDGSLLYVHDRQDDKKIPASQGGQQQRSRRKQLLSVCITSTVLSLPSVFVVRFIYKLYFLTGLPCNAP